MALRWRYNFFFLNDKSIVCVFIKVHDLCYPQNDKDDNEEDDDEDDNDDNAFVTRRPILELLTLDTTKCC